MNNLDYVIDNIQNTNCDEERSATYNQRLYQKIYMREYVQNSKFYSEPILNNHGIRVPYLCKSICRCLS